MKFSVEFSLCEYELTHCVGWDSKNELCLKKKKKGEENPIMYFKGYEIKGPDGDKSIKYALTKPEWLTEISKLDKVAVQYALDYLNSHKLTE